MMPTTPSPDPAALRGAYLDLLKLSLCDLVSTSTTSVTGLPHGRVAARELAGKDRDLRLDGRDWPAHGLTMGGLKRLDDLQRCVESVVADGIGGDLIEAGCWRGGSSILMRATLDSLGEQARTLWVADSFQGFPAPDLATGASAFAGTLEPYLSVFDFLAVPLEEVRANFSRLGLEQGVHFVPGFFEETLPGLSDRHWSIVRLDSDTYDSTLLALRCLYPGLATGGYLIVDDFLALEECRAAVEHFRAEQGIDEPLETVDWTCARWRKLGQPGPHSVSGQLAAHPGFPGGPPAARSVRAMPRAERGRVPAHEELGLVARIAELENALAAAERAGRERSQALERELQTITASISWRVTRPVRELARQIRERQRSRRR